MKVMATGNPCWEALTCVECRGPAHGFIKPVSVQGGYLQYGPGEKKPYCYRCAEPTIRKVWGELTAAMNATAAPAEPIL